MAKRKRLTPANPDYLAREGGETTAPPGPFAAAPAPAAATSRAPIAQVAGEASSAAALGELSRAMEEARATGRMILALPLDEVAADHLVRDRLVADDEEMRALKESLAARGQQTPVEVVDRGAGAVPRYGLISGWRRLAALRALAGEGRGPGEVLAVIRTPEAAPDAYVAMVEENEIRVGLSYYERARIVVKAVEAGVFPDRLAALRALFGSVSRAKRSKIGSFAGIVEALDGALAHPAALPERAGLDLARRLAEDPDLAARLRADLAARPPADAGEELARLAAGPKAGTRAGPGTGGAKSRGRGPASAPAPAGSGAVEIAHDASAGRITLTGPGVDAGLRAALEAWLASGGRDPA